MRSREKKETKKETSLHDLKEAITKHYENEKLKVYFPSLNIPVGNALIDGEIKRKDGLKIAVELKGPRDTNIVKGIGQLVEAAANGYHQAILVVTEKRARTIRRQVFEKVGIGLVGVSPEGNVNFLVQARNLEFSGADWHVAGKPVINSEPDKRQSKTSFPNFVLQRFQELVAKPVRSNWSIRILHPDKPIEKCLVLYDGIRLPWWDRDTPYYERTIVTGGGGNVRIPIEIEKEDAKVKVMDGKRTLRQEKFRDIVTSSP